MRGLTEAGLVVLGEAGGTAAGEGANGVDTEELAVVLPGGTLIQVCGTDGPRAQARAQLGPGASQGNDPRDGALRHAVGRG